MEKNEFCNCDAFRKISSNMTKIYDDALLASGLKVTQYGLLKYINILKNSTLKDLSVSMGRNRNTLGRNIKVLERQNFIYLRKGKDKREINISITKKGYQVLKVARKCWVNINDEMTKNLGINRKKILDEILNDKIFKTRELM